MLTNANEMLAYNHEGRQLRVPELGSWVEFDCTDCGTHTESSIDTNRVLFCAGCEAHAVVPVEWDQQVAA